MPPTVYAYKIVDTQFAEKIGAGVGTQPLSVSVCPDGITTIVVMPDALSDEQKLLLDEFMSTRNLFPQTKGAILLASSTLVPLSANITNPLDWDILAGVVTNPSFFISDITRAFGLLVASVKVSGTGAVLRVAEEKDGDRVIMGEFPLVDTGGVWVNRKFPTIAPRQSDNDMTYILEGTLGDATSASIRFVSLTLMETL